MGGNLTRQYYRFKLMYVIGYNNPFTVVRRKYFCKLFPKDNSTKLLGINPTSLSPPRAESLDIIDLWPVTKLIGISPMSLSAPWSDSIDIIALNPIKKILGIKPMGLSSPWADSLDIISLRPVKIWLEVNPV